MQTWFIQLTASKTFHTAVISLILLSTVLAGVECQLPAAYQGIAQRLEYLMLALFTLEIALRIGAHGKTPWRFFSELWNVFDFVVVAVCYLPAGQFVVALRIVRVLRVLRLLTSVQQAEIEQLKNVELAKAYQALQEEKAHSERLLLNILPQLIAQRLKGGAKIIADSYPDVTVIFADIVGFTQMSAQLTPEQLVQILDDIFCRFDLLAEQHGVEKIKTIGDAYMAVAGVPEERSDHVHAAAGMALAMQASLAEYSAERKLPLHIRVGFHCGPVVAGIIGQKKFIYDLWGDTVNTASRMESHGIADKIQVTEAVYQRLQSSHCFTARGTLDIKGKGRMTTYLLDGPLTPATL